MEFKKCENPACENMVTEYTKWWPIKLREHCSNKCRGIHNALKSREKAKQTCVERHGVDNASQSDKIKEKKRNTCLKNHGVDNPQKSTTIKEKSKKTMLERHGVEYSMQSSILREKAKITNLERHGVEHIFQSEIMREKAKITNLERHGVDNVFKSEKIKDKIRQTNRSKYGVENPSQSPEIKARIRETNLKNHGTEHSFNSKQVIDKIKKSNIKRHGVDNVFKSEKIKDKIRQTNRSKYGSDSWINSHIPSEIMMLINNPIWLKEQNTTKSLIELADELNIKVGTLCKRFKKFNIPVKHHPKSYFEKQVFEFVKSIYQDVIQNDRTQIKPLELDIWFPKLNMAIECNGRYFHQDQEREQNKIDKCKEKGIDLHFIWDDEWYAAMDDVKNRISTIINERLTNTK